MNSHVGTVEGVDFENNPSFFSSQKIRDAVQNFFLRTSQTSNLNWMDDGQAPVKMFSPWGPDQPIEDIDIANDFLSEISGLNWVQHHVVIDAPPTRISKFRWLESFYALQGKKIEDASITGEFLSKINEMLNGDRLYDCDLLLEEVDVEKLNPVFMVALVRGSFVARKDLKNWESCRDMVKERLDALGYNGRNVLRGLY